jgi:hypothetical protein
MAENEPATPTDAALQNLLEVAVRLRHISSKATRAEQAAIERAFRDAVDAWQATRSGR